MWDEHFGPVGQRVDRSHLNYCNIEIGSVSEVGIVSSEYDELSSNWG